jgi:hypothetical protein
MLMLLLLSSSPIRIRACREGMLEVLPDESAFRRWIPQPGFHRGPPGYAAATAYGLSGIAGRNMGFCRALVSCSKA